MIFILGGDWRQRSQLEDRVPQPDEQPHDGVWAGEGVPGAPGHLQGAVESRKTFKLFVNFYLNCYFIFGRFGLSSSSTDIDHNSNSADFFFTWSRLWSFTCGSSWYRPQHLQADIFPIILSLCFIFIEVTASLDGSALVLTADTELSASKRTFVEPFYISLGHCTARWLCFCAQRKEYILVRERTPDSTHLRLPNICPPNLSLVCVRMSGRVLVVWIV